MNSLTLSHLFALKKYNDRSGNFAQVLQMRVVRLATKEESEHRNCIASEERLSFNRIYHEFFVEQATLRSADNASPECDLLGVALSSQRVSRFSQRNYRGRLGLSKGLYHCRHVRMPYVRALKRTHYFVPPLDDSSLLATMLPPMPPHELRHLSVKEAIARQDIARDEEEVFRQLLNYFSLAHEEVSRRVVVKPGCVSPHMYLSVSPKKRNHAKV